MAVRALIIIMLHLNREFLDVETESSYSKYSKGAIFTRERQEVDNLLLRLILPKEVHNLLEFKKNT